jgi:N-acetylmuramic acid 6-phosphate etherase
MTARQTELSHPSASGFDLLPKAEALTILARAQVEASAAVEAAAPSIAEGAALAARTISNGGKLVYAAAGSSGLMALADALELPGTYGIDANQIVMLFAGGLADMTRMPGGPEDDVDAARADVAHAGVGPGDCLIAVTASGSTPYPLAAAEAARAVGASTIGVANNAGAPLFGRVDVAICLPTPAEVIAGSTRMGAGTAQKIALNMLSTMMAVELGHVHDGYMVNVVADNLKLQERARRIVMAVSDADEARAGTALQDAEGRVKPAILLAAGASDIAVAENLLKQHKGKLRPALAALGQAVAV